MKIKRLYIEIMAFLVVLIASFLISEDKIIFVNIFFIGSVLIVVPRSIKNYLEFRHIQAIENEFPNFLRDLSEEVRSGLSIVQAFGIVSKSDYGPLSPEIKKMNNQLSWNIRLERVLQMFKERLNKSDIIVKSITIISEAQRSGGNIAEILEKLADNVEKIRQVKNEKATLLHQQVITLYAIFFIFIGISIALLKFLLPMMAIQQGSGFEMQGLAFGTSPCEQCLTTNIATCFPCKMSFTICQLFGFGPIEKADCYFRTLFFSMIIIQGLFTGLIAGQIETGSTVGGIKHSLIMFSSGFIIFLILIRIGFI
ncbi:MAG: type II secretion system F family protein [Candidatus Aenigmarchaeota archaeon]|nr:type II secretion system F family protein [Candidatus Aenigmarchaeota archaeon]